MIPNFNKPAGFRFPTVRLSEADFQRLDRVREGILEKARRTVDPEGTGFDMMMQGSDDGSFFGPTEDPLLDDWRDRMIDVISIASRRVSLAVLATGFAIAGATMVGGGTTSGFGQASLVLSGVFTIWATAANLFGLRSGR
jgi:hypothetical protein